MKRPILYQRRRLWLAIAVTLVLFLVSNLVVQDAALSIGAQSCYENLANEWFLHRPNASPNTCRRDLENASSGQEIKVELRERDLEGHMLKVEEEHNPKEELEPKAEEEIELKENSFEPKNRKLKVKEKRRQLDEQLNLRLEDEGCKRQNSKEEPHKRDPEQEGRERCQKEEAEVERQEQFLNFERVDQPRQLIWQDEQENDSNNLENNGIGEQSHIKSDKESLPNLISQLSTDSETDLKPRLKLWDEGELRNGGDEINAAEEERRDPEYKASKEKMSETNETSKESFKPDEVLLPRDEQFSARLGHKCNLNDGTWEYDEADPLYTNETCSFINDDWNCMRNGRLDDKYLHWRWNPKGCELPRFNAEEFLRTVKGKTIGFVGDSLARNQMLSLACMLSQAEKPLVIYESFYHKKYTFKRHQVTIMVVWAPFLVKHSTEPMPFLGKNSTEPVQDFGVEIASVVYMGELDPKWTSKLDEMDIVIVSIGHWYFRPTLQVSAGGTKVLGCSMCPPDGVVKGRHVKMALDMFGATLRMGLERLLAPSEKARVVVVTTFSVQHFTGSDWVSGKCDFKQPLRPEEASKFGWLKSEMRDVVFDELSRAVDLLGDGDGGSSVSLDVIDITKVTLLRADGHPGSYQHPNPLAQWNQSKSKPNDCLHWCMPGPVDTWNQMLFESLKRFSVGYIEEEQRNLWRYQDFMRGWSLTKWAQQFVVGNS